MEVTMKIEFDKTAIKLSLSLKSCIEFLLQESLSLILNKIPIIKLPKKILINIMKPNLKSFNKILPTVPKTNNGLTE